MSTSKYKQILARLRKQILGSEFSAENPFPSEASCARSNNVTRNTVHRAYVELRRMGLIEGDPGMPPRITRIGSSRKIGLVVPGVAYSEFFPPIVSEISRLAQKVGYALIFGDVNSKSPAKRVQQAKLFARKLVKEGVLGVIYQPLEFIDDVDGPNREIVSVFDRSRIPVVLIDYDIVSPPDRSKYDFVGINNFEAGRRLTQHLVDCGARRISFYAGSRRVDSVRNRFEGMAYVTNQIGTTMKDNILVAESDDLKTIATYLRRHRPDAFICGNDAYAAALRLALSRLGKRVPDDIMLAGFDDVRHAIYMLPQLTTIHQPCKDIAAMAFRVLMERISRPDLPAREIFLSAPLVVRESTVGTGVKTRKGTKK